MLEKCHYIKVMREEGRRNKRTVQKTGERKSDEERESEEKNKEKVRKEKRKRENETLTEQHWMDNVGDSMAANNVTDTCHFLRGLSISEIIATNLICTWEGGWYNCLCRERFTQGKWLELPVMTSVVSDMNRNNQHQLTRIFLSSSYSSSWHQKLTQDFFIFSQLNTMMSQWVLLFLPCS